MSADAVEDAVVRDPVRGYDPEADQEREEPGQRVEQVPGHLTEGQVLGQPQLQGEQGDRDSHNGVAEVDRTLYRVAALDLLRVLCIHFLGPRDRNAPVSAE